MTSSLVLFLSLLQCYEFDSCSIIKSLPFCQIVIILYSANGLGTLEAVQTVLMMMVLYNAVELNEFET